jgi:hypothetical protein
MFYALPDAVQLQPMTWWFFQMNCQQEVIWLISNFFACFQSAKLSFSKTIFLPVVGIDYVWFQYPDLNFVMRRTGFKCATIPATNWSVQEWSHLKRNRLRWDRRTWTFKIWWNSWYSKIGNQVDFGMIAHCPSEWSKKISSSGHVTSFVLLKLINWIRFLCLLYSSPFRVCLGSVRDIPRSHLPLCWKWLV